MPPTFLRHTLDNGLVVLIRPLPATATVSSWIFYRVGVRNEIPGQTGASHWVEHMTFKGTDKFGKGEIARQVNRRGGTWNGFTYLDWTAYFETLPAEHAPLALQIEADRMAGVRFDPTEVEAERTVVLSEREGAENDPSYLLQEEVAALALRVHPYRQPVVGWKEDLRTLSRDDLLRHYRTYYAPNNAVLVMAGAIEEGAALAAAAEQFGSIPAVTPPPPPRAVEPSQQAERRLVLRRPGPTPILEVAFPAPPAGDGDFIPFLVLDAVLGGAKGVGLLGGGPATYRSARLYRALVETELAVAAGSMAPVTLDSGIFTLHAVLRAGRSCEEVEPVLLAELEKLAQTAPAAEELARSTRQLQAQLAYGGESTTAQAYWLGSLDLVGRPEHLDTLLQEVAAVRPEDVQRVAATYLTPERRTVGWFVPGEAGPHPLPPPGQARHAPPPLPLRGSGRGGMGRRGEGGGPPCPLPAADVVRRTLPGGTILLARENRVHPVVAVQGYIRGGSLLDPPGKEGLAQLTAQMLNRGSEAHSFRELHEALEGMGAGLEFSAGQHSLTFSGKSLAEDLPRLLELLVEMLRRPAFPPSEWERLRGETLTQLRHFEDDPDYVADRAFRELLYPEGHPNRRRGEGGPDSVAAMEKDDLADYYRRHVHPAGLVIAVAGDVAAAEVEARLTELLAAWEAPPPGVEPAVPPIPRPLKVQRVTRTIPGKSQASLVWGVPGLARSDPDYYAALLANVVLGQLGLMGRLGTAVRDAEGLAYSVFSALEAGVAAGPWLVRAGVAPQNVERAVEGIVREVGRFLEGGPSEEERADAASYLSGQMALRLETNDGVAGTLLAMERFVLGMDFVERYAGILERLTRGEIVQVAGRYLSTSGYALAVAGPAAGSSLAGEF